MVMTETSIEYKFDKNKELDVSKQLMLLHYAVKYLEYVKELDSKKHYKIVPNFWANSWTIRVDVTRKVLGFKRTKSYHFALDSNKVELIVPSKIPNEYAYTIKETISDTLSYKNPTFLCFLYAELKDQAEEYGITEIEKEYTVLPFQYG